MAKGIKKSIDACLNKMHSVGGMGKGVIGEEAVFKLCEQFYQKRGGILYHSFEYKSDMSLPGNIKNDNGRLFIEATASTTEIDILYVSKHRIYPIEVKAYRTKSISLKDDFIEGCYKVDKNPVHQNEMHCRHLYSPLFKVIPEGLSKYITPIVCFVDKATVRDLRSPEQRDYIYITNINGLGQMIYNFEEEKLYYDLDLPEIEKELNNISVKVKCKLPLRLV